MYLKEGGINMIDINTLVLEDDVLAYADWDNPCGVLGVLESAKNALLSIPKMDRTQTDADLSFVPIGDLDDSLCIEITDFDLNNCRLIAEEKRNWSYRIRSISVTLTGWNSFVDFFREQGLISSNEAIIL